MKTWVIRLFLAGLILGLGFWGWRVLFPNPEKVIRNRLNEVAQLASFAANEGALAKLSNSQKLANYFTPDVEVTISIPGQASGTLTGRDDLVQRATAARYAAGGLAVELPDISANVAPDKKSAVVEVTCKARIAGDRDVYVQELKLEMIKDGGSWLIRKVETVRTLR